jgi:hypothetical protein
MDNSQWDWDMTKSTYTHRMMGHKLVRDFFDNKIWHLYEQRGFGVSPTGLSGTLEQMAAEVEKGIFGAI